MNGLINDIFGDKSITLDCDAGECLHYTQVPGYEVSPIIRHPGENRLNIFSIATATTQQQSLGWPQRRSSRSRFPFGLPA